jgi:hypothetical protein
MWVSNTHTPIRANPFRQFVTVDDVKILRDIEQFYSTQIVRILPHTTFVALANT